MVKADFVTGLVLVALGIAAVVESLRMPRFEQLDIEPYTVPGLVPGALGAVILLLGALLSCARRAPAAGAQAAEDAPAHAWPRRRRRLRPLPRLRRGVWSGRLPFWLATFLFVSRFVVRSSSGTANLRAALAPPTIVALLFGALISFGIAGVPGDLPGPPALRSFMDGLRYSVGARRVRARPRHPVPRRLGDAARHRGRRAAGADRDARRRAAHDADLPMAADIAILILICMYVGAIYGGSRSRSC